jgi:hypothetical protein
MLMDVLTGVPEDMRTSIIKVYSYDDKNLQGTFYDLYYGEEIPFNNLTRLLFLMEDMMDEMDYPQSSVHSRSFARGLKDSERSSIVRDLRFQANQEVIATFQVKVLFRQGASWQGKIGWTEGEKEETFRSALELIKLMDSALPQPAAQEQKKVCAATGTGFAFKVEPKVECTQTDAFHRQKTAKKRHRSR